MSPNGLPLWNMDICLSCFRRRWIGKTYFLLDFAFAEIDGPCLKQSFLMAKALNRTAWKFQRQTRRRRISLLSSVEILTTNRETCENQDSK